MLRYLVVLIITIYIFHHPTSAQRNVNMRIGQNIDGPSYYGCDFMFKDVFKESSSWVIYSDVIPGWDSGVDRNILPKDENGWPNAGVPYYVGTVGGVDYGNISYRSLSIRQNCLAYPLGDYYVFWEGAGTIQMNAYISSHVTTAGTFGTIDSGGNNVAGAGVTVTGSSIISNSLPGVHYCRINIYYSSGGGGIQTTILQSETAPNHIRNISIVIPNTDPTIGSANAFADPTNAEFFRNRPFHPAYLYYVKPFGILRFMGFMGTNSVTFASDQSWSKRKPLNYYSQGAGGDGGTVGTSPAFEYIIKLCNETKSDAWINIPTCADDNFIAELAQLFKDSLNPDLHVYLELGNEATWNFAPGFASPFILNSLLAANPGYGNILNVQSAKESNMWKRFYNVFGAENYRVHGLLMGQAVNSYQCAYRMNWHKQNGTAKYYDHIGVTWYYGGGASYYPSNATPAQVNAIDKSDLALVNTVSGSFTNTINQHSILAQTYGKKLALYEGGKGGFEDSNNDGYKFAKNDPSIRPVYSQVLDTLRNYGVDIAMHFIDFGGYDNNSGTEVCSYGSVPSSLSDTISSKSLTLTFGAFTLEGKNKHNVWKELITQMPKTALTTITSDNVGAGLSLKFLNFHNTYVNASGATKPDAINTNFSIEAWVKPGISGSAQDLVSFSNNSNGNSINSIRINDQNQINWYITDASGAVKLNLIGPIVKTGKWVHIAGTKGACGYKLYVNGTLVQVSPSMSGTFSATRLTLGAVQGVTSINNLFYGELDEVRIWTSEISQGNIRNWMCKTISNSHPNFTSFSNYYQFNSISGFNLYDSKNRTNNGILINFSSINKAYQTSGAPVGEESINSYPASWGGVSLSYTNPNGGDVFSVFNMGKNSADGVHLYVVNQPPKYNHQPKYYTGLSNKFYGVFMANGDSSIYDVNYIYQGNPSASSNPYFNRLLKRNDNSDSTWDNTGAILNNVVKSLSVSCKESYRSEYILATRQNQLPILPGSGKALSFTGIGGGVLKDFRRADSSYTVSFWAIPGNYGNIIWFGNGATNSSMFSVADDGTFFTRCNSQGVSTASTQNIYGKPGQWNHFVAVKKGNLLSLYINGIFAASGPASTADNGLVDLNVGTRGFEYSSNYVGAIDELSVWSTALDQNEVRSLMCKKITANHPKYCYLQSYFKFDEGSGTVLENMLGAGNLEFTSTKWIPSGAAIGDESAFNYNSPFKKSISHPDGDFLDFSYITNSNTNTSYGVQLFRVDGASYFTAPLPTGIVSYDSSRYWGVYPVTSQTWDKPNFTYALSYNYASDKKVNLAQENKLRMLDRANGSYLSWLLASVSGMATNQDVVNHRFNLTVNSAISFRTDELMLGATSTVSFNFNTSIPTVSGITGKKLVCQGESALIYKINKPTDLNASNYLWSGSSGLSVGSSTSDSVLVNIISNTSGVQYLSVVGINKFGRSSPPTVYAITVVGTGYLSADISGPLCVAQGQIGVQYSVTGVSPRPNSYTWAVPSAVSIASGGNSTSVGLNFGTGISKAIISVYGNYSCGTTLINSIQVNVNPTPSDISLAGDAICSTSSTQYAKLTLYGAESGITYKVYDGMSLVSSATGLGGDLLIDIPKTILNPFNTVKNLQVTAQVGNCNLQVITLSGTAPVSQNTPLTSIELNANIYGPSYQICGLLGGPLGISISQFPITISGTRTGAIYTPILNDLHLLGLASTASASGSVTLTVDPQQNPWFLSYSSPTLIGAQAFVLGCGSQPLTKYTPVTFIQSDKIATPSKVVGPGIGINPPGDGNYNICGANTSTYFTTAWGGDQNTFYGRIINVPIVNIGSDLVFSGSLGQTMAVNDILYLYAVGTTPGTNPANALAYDRFTTKKFYITSINTITGVFQIAQTRGGSPISINSVGANVSFWAPVTIDIPNGSNTFTIPARFGNTGLRLYSQINFFSANSYPSPVDPNQYTTFYISSISGNNYQISGLSSSLYRSGLQSQEFFVGQGKISITSGSNLVIGSGTNFNGEGLETGAVLRDIDENVIGIVAAINSNTSITLQSNYAGSSIINSSYSHIKPITFNSSGQGVVLTAPADADNNGYNWHVSPAGAVVSIDGLGGNYDANGGTYIANNTPLSTEGYVKNAITVVWASTFSGTALIGVISNNSCGQGTSSSEPFTPGYERTEVSVRINSKIPTTPSPISNGNSALCQAPATTNYSSLSPNATGGYLWQIFNAGSTSLNNSNQSTVIVNWQSGFKGTPTIQVAAIGCDGITTSTSANLTITIGGVGNSTPSVVGPVTRCEGTLSGQYTATAVSLGKLYWFMFPATVTSDIYSGLVAYYPFNGNSLNEAFGPLSVGSTADATRSGAIAFAADKNAIANKALSYPSTSSYLSNSGVGMSFTDQMTFAAWINPSNLSTIKTLIQRERSFKFYILPNGQLAFNFYKDYAETDIFPTQPNGVSSTTTIGGAGDISTGSWYHIAFTYDNSGENVGLNAYLNGVLIGSITASGSSIYNNIYSTDNLYIGNWPYSDQYNFLGSMDEVMFYNRALQASEISSLYSLNGNQLAMPDVSNIGSIDLNTGLASWNNTFTGIAKVGVVNQGCAGVLPVTFYTVTTSSKPIIASVITNDPTSCTPGSEGFTILSITGVSLPIGTLFDLDLNNDLVFERFGTISGVNTITITSGVSKGASLSNITIKQDGIQCQSDAYTYNYLVGGNVEPDISLAINPTDPTGICVGNPTGVVVTNSETGIFYQAFTGAGVNISNTVSGTGGFITLSGFSFASAGNYPVYVRATSLVCGTYTLAGLANIEVNNNSLPGTISGPSGLVCNGTNPILTVAGTTGQIQWQSSSDGIVYADIPGETYPTLDLGMANTGGIFTYRPVVTNIGCSPVTGTGITMTVNGIGNIIGSTGPYCSNQTTYLSVTGYNGGNLKWFTSTDFTNYNEILGQTGTQLTIPGFTFLGLNYYKAQLDYLTCPSITTPSFIISAQGSTTTTSLINGPNYPFCAGGNAALTLTGYSGGSISWMQSNDNISYKLYDLTTTVTSLINATTNGNNFFKVIIKTGALLCPATTTSFIVTISGATASGTVTGTNSSLCQSSTSLLTLSGFGGTTVVWQSSNDNFVSNVVSVSTVTGAGVSTFLSIRPFGTPGIRFYRALVYNLACSGLATSASFPITVTSSPVLSLNYGQQAYCTTSSNPIPSFTSFTGGYFSTSSANLILNSVTGTINIPSSKVGNYQVVYNVPGGCGVSTISSNIIINSFTGLSLGYNGNPYCANSGFISPTVNTLAGGYFSAAPSGLKLNTLTGIVDLGLSNAGNYTVSYGSSILGCGLSTTTAGLIINSIPNLSISYSPGVFCQSIGSVSPSGTFSGGSFNSSPSGLVLNTSTGIVNLATSNVGVYSISYSVSVPGCGLISTATGFTINGINAFPSVTVSATNTSICASQTITFTGVPTNGGITPKFQWRVNGVNQPTNTATFASNSLANNDVVDLIMTSSGICVSPITATSTGITLTVSPVLNPSISINASATTICPGATVTFTGIPTNAGTLPTYQWRVNGNLQGTNSIVFISNSLADADVVDVILQSNALCVNNPNATATGITLTVSGSIIPLVNLNTDSRNICSGAGVSFTASGINGGGFSLFTFYLNNNEVQSGVSTFYNTTNVSNNDVVKVVMSATGSCLSLSTATSTGVTLTVNGMLTPSVMLNSDYANICSGTGIGFTASGINGGNLPLFTFYVGNSAVQASTGNVYNNTSLSDNNIIKVVMSSSGSCLSSVTATSTGITLTVNPNIDPSISVIASVTTICSGNTVTFSGFPVNGGTIPSFQWRVDGNPQGSNDPVFLTNSLTNGQLVDVVLNSNALCLNSITATSTGISIAVNPNINPSIIAISNVTTICSGATISFTGIPTNGGFTPTFQWRVDGNPQGISDPIFVTNSLTKGQIVDVVLTSSELCLNVTTATSAGISLTVNALITPTVTINTNNATICTGTLVNFTASGSNVGNTPNYAFYVNNNELQSGTNNFYSNSVLFDNDIIKVVMSATGSCLFVSTANSEIVIHVNPPSNPLVSISGNTNFCEGETTTLLGFTNATNNFQSQWFVNNVKLAANSTSLINNNWNNGDNVFLVVTAAGFCPENAVGISNTLTINIAQIIYPTVSITGETNAVCLGTPLDFGSTIANQGTSPSLVWLVNGIPTSQTDATFSTDSLHNNDIVQLELRPIETCANPKIATSNQIKVIITSPITASDVIFEDCKNPVINFSLNGGDNAMYTVVGTSLTGTTLIRAGSTFTSPQMSKQITPIYFITDNSVCPTITVTGPAIDCPCFPLAVSIITISGEIFGDTEACKGETLAFKLKRSSLWQNVNWSAPNNAKIVASDSNSVKIEFFESPSNGDTLAAYAIGQCGNSNLIVKILMAKEDCNLHIPKAFSPDDNENIVWNIKGIEKYPEVSIKVFNRWGQELFTKSNGYQNDWNGDYKGNALPAGTYYYVIDLKNGKKQLTGNVTILR